MSIKQKIDALRTELQAHDYRYYVLDSPSIADESYDRLFHELVALEKTHPEFITKDSPTQRVGQPPLESFGSFPHPSRMYSLDNAFQDKDIHAWFQRISRLQDISSSSFVAEPKLDGLSIEILYEDGILVGAGTRGDGFLGEDVTENIRTIRSIPLSIKSIALKQHISYPKTFRVRGEVIMKTDDFLFLNQERIQQGDSPFANPRNAAAGSLRQLDSAVTAQRKLTAFFYFLTDLDLNFSPFPTQMETLTFLQSLGFPINSEIRLIDTIEEIEDYQDSLKQKRHDLGYEIDGSVIKINKISLWDPLGYTARAPRWAIAYKFQAEQVTTTIQGIRISVGRTGILTPVAELCPVEVGGVTVSNATLHNQGEIARKDIRLFDTVLVQRAGDVIPEVVSVDLTKRPGRSTPFVMPSECPICHTPVYQNAEEAYIRCVNINCPARIEESFSHFTSKAGMDIDGLGERMIHRLLAENRIEKIPDLYQLTVQDFMTLDGVQEKLSNKLIISIQDSKNRPFWRFLSGIGIDGVGETTAKLLATHFSSIQNIMKASFEEFLAISGIGPETAASIYQFFHNTVNILMVEQLIQLGLTLSVSLSQTQAKKPLSEKSFVLTGTLSIPRSTMKKIIEGLGGTVHAALTLKTNFVITGDHPGSKIDKAHKQGIPVITEEEFFHRWKSYP